MIDNFNHTLKELGDVENWARAIETDMIAIASALEYAYKGKFLESQWYLIYVDLSNCIALFYLATTQTGVFFLH